MRKRKEAHFLPELGKNPRGGRSKKRESAPPVKEKKKRGRYSACKKKVPWNGKGGRDGVSL